MMREKMIIRILGLVLGLILFTCPYLVEASEFNSSKEKESFEKPEAPNKMTQEEMNNLFGEDPYLGQTSYLQSPEGFIQNEKRK